MLRALIVLMLGAFVSQTTEYLPIGLLPMIASDLHVSQATVGWLVTGYAWIITLSVVPMTLMTRHIDRRRLFLTLLAIITICNGLSLLTHQFWMLMILRAIAALGHGVFWASIAAYAIKLAPQMSSQRATAIVFSGISLAIVVGVPISTAIGQHFGWQQGFALFGALGLLVLMLAWRWLPSMKAPGNEQGAKPAAFSCSLWTAVGITLLMVTAHFTSYTYITPLLLGPLQVVSANVPALLLVFGLAGAAGTVLAGVLSLHPAITAFFAGVVLVVSQYFIAYEFPAALVMAMWGTAIAMLIIGLQSWVIMLSPDNPEGASALYVMAFNIGIGGGAVIGGLWLASADVPWLLRTSMLIGAAGLLIIARMKVRRSVKTVHS